MGARKWRGKLDPKTTARVKKSARAAARPYLTGEKREKWYSPRKIREHGQWKSPKEAAKSIHLQELGPLIGARYPTTYLQQHWHRKSAVGTKTTSRGGKWTLRKANVRRAGDGTFRKRT